MNREIEPLPRESTNPVKGSNENEENQRNNIDIELSGSTPIKRLELTNMNKVAPITINSPLNENSHKVNNGNEISPETNESVVRQFIDVRHVSESGPDGITSTQKNGEGRQEVEVGSTEEADDSERSQLAVSGEGGRDVDDPVEVQEEEEKREDEVVPGLGHELHVIFVAPDILSHGFVEPLELGKDTVDTDEVKGTVENVNVIGSSNVPIQFELSSHSIVCKSENEAHSDKDEVQGNNSPIRHQDLNDGGDRSDSILDERSTSLFLRHFYSSKNRMCQIQNNKKEIGNSWINWESNGACV